MFLFSAFRASFPALPLGLPLHTPQKPPEEELVPPGHQWRDPAYLRSLIAQVEVPEFVPSREKISLNDDEEGGDEQQQPQQQQEQATGGETESRNAEAMDVDDDEEEKLKKTLRELEQIDLSGM